MIDTPWLREKPDWFGRGVETGTQIASNWMQSRLMPLKIKQAELGMLNDLAQTEIARGRLDLEQKRTAAAVAADDMNRRQTESEMNLKLAQDAGRTDLAAAVQEAAPDLGTPNFLARLNKVAAKHPALYSDKFFLDLVNDNHTAAWRKEQLNAYESRWREDRASREEIAAERERTRKTLAEGKIEAPTVTFSTKVGDSTVTEKVTSEEANKRIRGMESKAEWDAKLAANKALLDRYDNVKKWASAGKWKVMPGTYKEEASELAAQLRAVGIDPDTKKPLAADAAGAAPPTITARVVRGPDGKMVYEKP